MLSFLLRPRFVITAIALCLPLTASGACGGRTACFGFTQAEFQVNGSACPAPKDALGSFTDPSCPGAVVSVDGPGTFDGELCCYPATYDDIQSDCGMSNGGGVSGGSGFGAGVTTGFQGEVGEATASSSFASSGTGLGSCTATCSAALVQGGMPCPGTGLVNFNQLQLCAGCFGGEIDGGGGSCGEACSDFCNSTFSPDGNMECISCLQPSCTDTLMACQGS